MLLNRRSLLGYSIALCASKIPLANHSTVDLDKLRWVFVTSEEGGSIGGGPVIVREEVYCVFPDGRFCIFQNIDDALNNLLDITKPYNFVKDGNRFLIFEV